jgi:signal peptidase II
MLSTNLQIQKKTVLFIILAVFFVVLDRFLEALCLYGYFDQPVPIIGNIFSLNYVKNYYIAFSLPFSGPILTAIIGLIILLLTIYLLKSLFSPNTKHQILNTKYALTVLIIGAILNFTDRLKFGFVIDYFYLKYFTIFNLADMMITFSTISLLIISFKNKHEKL